MNILFEFLTVSIKTGAGEYHRRVFFELLKHKREHPEKHIKVYALYDSNFAIAYEDLTVSALSEKYDICFLDCAEKRIDALIEENSIDVFFIACAQYLRTHFEISHLKCKVIGVIHDMAVDEFVGNNLYTYMHLLNPAYLVGIHLNWIQRLCQKLFFPKYFRCMDGFTETYLRIKYDDNYSRVLGQLQYILKLKEENPETKLVTVSEFSRASIVYNCNIDIHDVDVLYSPERISLAAEEIENIKLRELIDKKVPYYLMVSAKIEQKNPFKTIQAFKKYQKVNPNAVLVTVGFAESCFHNHIVLPFLSDSDLAHAYKNCYALIYPSFCEGFGYPPIECMHYGKPVLASNTTSIPEILGDSAIYFSPFYESEIFHALCNLTTENYDEQCQKSIERYEYIHQRQEKDLSRLIDLMVS